MILVQLPGLDGRNPLVFLAAVGTQVALDRKAALIARLLGGREVPSSSGGHLSRSRRVRMSWHPETFRPTIHLPLPAEISGAAAERTSAVEDCLIRVLQHGLEKLGEVDAILPFAHVAQPSRTQRRQSV